jgi:enediyne biosynthesis protein E4
MRHFGSIRKWLLAAGASMLAMASSSSVHAAFTEQQTAWLNDFNPNAEVRSASLADIDNDGDLDLFFQGGASSARQIFRNNVLGTGAHTFTNVTSTYLPSSVASTLGSSWSAAWGDYNGDNKIDVFVGQTNSGISGDVLMNNGPNVAFTNTSAVTGLTDLGFHQNVGWIDIDNDRDLDLLIGMEGPEKHEVYLQGPGHTFTAVGAAVGFQQSLGTRGYGMAMGDSDGDGDVDVFISTCQPGGNVRNNFYKNMLKENGSLSFVDLIAASNNNGTQDIRNTYGSEFVDFDDDGDLDLYVTGADSNPTKIYRNDGGNMFTDVDTILGHPLLSTNGSDMNGSKAIDYDNDGDLDLYFHDRVQLAGRPDQGRYLFRNDGNWQFTDVTVAEGLSTVNMEGFDSAWGDIDLDGDQDIISPTFSDYRERLYISDESTNGNHWLYLNLNGPKDNTSGIGAAVYATINEGTPEERTLRREANTNANTFNQSDLPVHFGLGATDIIDILRIVWPDGTEQILHDVDANQYLTVNISGDFNGDGVVDSGDLAQWAADYAANGDSDMDGDGDSDGADFLAWQQHLGNGSAFVTAASSAVPEPASAALAVTAAIAAVGAARRRV